YCTGGPPHRQAERPPLRIEGREQTRASGLAGDGGERRAAVGRSVDAAPLAAVGEADEDAALGVDGGVDEVEEVPRAAAGGAGDADGAALHRVAGGGVDGRPAGAAGRRRGDIEVPDCREGGVVAGGVASRDR